MAPLRTRKSSLSSRVTLYEPAAPSASSSLSATASSAPASASPSRRRTRSSAALESPVKAESEADEAEEEDVKPVRGKGKGKGVKQEEEGEKGKKPRSPRKPKAHVEALAIPHPAPKGWEKTYEVIRMQRERIVAPVDTMGCEQGGRNAKKEEDGGGVPESQADRRLSTLVSLMLSSQTKDPVTHQATMNLRLHLPGGLTLRSLERATAEEIDACICKVGFHTTKANNLKRLAVHLREKHGGEVPSDLPSLLAIHGVGPKMAYLYLQSIGENLGIGVDTHVHRITNRLRWHKKETTTPEQTRLNLESWLPRELWPKVNKMLVGFGQEICRPVAPRCDSCDVGAERLCPSRRVVASSPAKKRVKVEVKEEVKEEEGGARVKVEIELEETVQGKVGIKKEEELQGGEEKETAPAAAVAAVEALKTGVEEGTGRVKREVD
ncbi:hypothetical protein JCM10207_001793 [Rhodosporidiobolus poonsookiae]